MTRTRLYAAGAALAAAAAGCDGPSFDTTGPKITQGPSVSVQRDTSLTIAWLTNERANSLVEYGETEDLGTVEIDNLFLITHVVTIKNLEPETEYHFRVASYDVFGNGPTRSDVMVQTTSELLPPPLVIISEVMANPVNDSTDEFIELYNAGTEAVDLTGFEFTDHTGDAPRRDILQPFTSEEPSVLDVGDYAIVLDAQYVDAYDIPAGVVRMKTQYDTLSASGLSSTDEISLYAPGVSDPSSTYGTPLVADTLPLASAEGVSIERADIGGADEEGNWCESEDPDGATPGEANSGCSPP